jgi:hypothetical protein
LQGARKRQADHGEGADQHADRDQPVFEFAHSSQRRGRRLVERRAPGNKRRVPSFLDDSPGGRKRRLVSRPLGALFRAGGATTRASSHSITSSARVSSGSGTSIPSALAVLILMTNSKSSVDLWGPQPLCRPKVWPPHLGRTIALSLIARGDVFAGPEDYISSIALLPKIDTVIYRVKPRARANTGRFPGRRPGTGALPRWLRETAAAAALTSPSADR